MLGWMRGWNVVGWVGHRYFAGYRSADSRRSNRYVAHWAVRRGARSPKARRPVRFHHLPAVLAAVRT
jgi:hypothetical protein